MTDVAETADLIEMPRNGGQDAPQQPEQALVTYSSVVPAQPGQALVSSGDPKAMIEMASTLATALADIVEKQRLYSVINGKKYPQVEAWATIGRLDNVVAREAGLPTRRDDGSYEAEVELIRLSDGMIVGRASAVCGMRGDNPWASRPEHNRRSMAFTRATSRAFRQQYSWIMALAGYEPTPADEMPNEQADPSVPSASVKPTQKGSSATGGERASPVVAGLTVTGEISKVADGIRRDSNTGEASYDVTFKVDGKTYHAMTTGTLAERVMRELKPSVGDHIEVEGTYVERPWTDKNGKNMPAVKEMHDITRVVIRDEALMGGVPADPPGMSQWEHGEAIAQAMGWRGTSGAATSETRGTEDAPTSASTTSSDDDLVDEALEAFEGMVVGFGEVGYAIDKRVMIRTAERKPRPRTGDHVVVGAAEYISATLDHFPFRFVTVHDFDPAPAPDDLVTFRGEFILAPDGAPIARGAIS